MGEERQDGAEVIEAEWDQGRLERVLWGRKREVDEGEEIVGGDG